MTEKELLYDSGSEPYSSKRRIINKILHSIGITVLAFLMSLLLASPLAFSFSSLFSLSDQEERNLSDFFSYLANQRPVRNLEEEIVIVDIGNADRNEIARMLEILTLTAPKAVGLDVMFSDCREGDELLIKTLKSVPNLVLPITMEISPDNTVQLKETSYFNNQISHKDGIVNLASKSSNGIIREFPTWFSDIKGDSIPSFPVAVALTANPDRKVELTKRGHKIETIDYPSHEFKVIPLADVMERADELLEKIILVGALSDISDLHTTPIGNSTSGLLIHAYAVTTIISQHYYTNYGMWLDWILAFVLCLFTVWVSIIIDKRIKGLFVRLLQLLIVYLVVQIGYYLYTDGRLIINLTYTMLMVTFGMFASDLWYGTQGAINLIKERRRK